MRKKYKRNKEKLAKLPDRLQIEAYKKRAMKKLTGSTKIETNADLCEFTAGFLLPDDLEAALALPKDRLVILPDGLFDMEDGSLFVFS